MNLDINIEELELHGFDRADSRRVARALEGELSRLFEEEGVPPSLSRGESRPSLDLGSFEAVPGARPEAVGVQVARSIYGGMKG